MLLQSHLIPPEERVVEEVEEDNRFRPKYFMFFANLSSFLFKIPISWSKLLLYRLNTGDLLLLTIIFFINKLPCLNNKERETYAMDWYYVELHMSTMRWWWFTYNAARPTDWCFFFFFFLSRIKIGSLFCRLYTHLHAINIDRLKMKLSSHWEKVNLLFFEGLCSSLYVDIHCIKALIDSSICCNG